MVPLSKLMRDSHNGDQFEGCKRLLLRFLVPVFRFYHLFCAITGKCLGLPATVWDLCRISDAQPPQPPRKACYLLNFAKNSQFSGECPGETGSYLTAHHHPVSANRTIPIRR